MTDFIVIGGGIAGVSAAARLSELGQVLLIERERHLAYHASGRSAAMFEKSYGKPSVVALNEASHEFHASADGGVLSPRGLMLLGLTGEDDAFEADLQTLKLEEISMDEAVDHVPVLNTKTVDRAAYHAEAWDLDTDRLIQFFLRHLTSNGGSVISNSGVTRIERTRKGWVVHTSQRTFHGAPHLVNAAGAWVDQIALMARIPPIGVTPCRRSMGRIPAPGDHDVSRWPMMMGTAESWYAKPDAGPLIVSPADEDPVDPHDAFAEDLTLAEGMARYEACVTEPVTRLLANWAGLRTFAPDRELVLGPDPLDPSFIWCAGQGGYGFQTAPAASQLLADVVSGRPADVGKEMADRLSPARFRRG